MLTTQEEQALFALYSYLPKSGVDSCYIKRSTYSKYSSAGGRIILKNPFDTRKGIQVSQKLIIDIATNEAMGEKIREFFEHGKSNEFTFRHVLQGDTVGVRVTRSTIIKGLELLIKHEPDSPDIDKYKALYTELYKTASPEALFHQYLVPEAFACRVDEVDKYFSPQHFLDVLYMTDYEYKKFISSPEEMVGTATKSEFMYALQQFAKREHIFDRFALPNSVIERFASIQSGETFDFEAINQLTSTDDHFQGHFKVSPKLEKEILSGIPQDYDPLSKAMYIYIKMCETLTYDQEFYAVKQRGPVARRHEDLDHIRTITPDKNDVVCYEFNSIYSHFLSQLGINYNIISKSGFIDDKQAYGGAHAHLTFRCGKFLVKADSVESILNGDLAALKTSSVVTGLKPLNKNPATQQEFNSLLGKVMQDIREQEEAETSDGITPVDEYQQALNMYFGLSNYSLPSVDRRVQTIREQMDRCDLDPMDAYCYLLQLRHKQFTTDEQEYCFKVSILRENPSNPFAPITTRSIWTTSQSFGMPEYPITYYSYKPGEKVEEVTQDEVLGDLRSGKLEYINSKNQIPGIVEEGGCYVIAPTQDE